MGYARNGGGGSVGGGSSGASAYDIWIANGNVGTQQDFLDSLVGAAGAAGLTMFYSSGAGGTVWPNAPMDLPQGQAWWWQTVKDGPAPPGGGRPGAYDNEPLTFKQIP